MMRTLFTAVLLSIGTPSLSSEDGNAWVQKAEQKLYRWPRSDGTLTFEATTDSLAPGIAAMERDLEKKPEARGAEVVAALKRLTIAGAVDLRTGAVSVVVSVDYPGEDSRTVGVISRVKTMVEGQVHGALDGLPLRDPSLLPKGSRLAGAELRGESVLVELRGPRGDELRTLEIDRASSLPVSMTLATMRLAYRYGEELPGRFVPVQVDAQPAGGSASRVTYSWTKVNEFLFPERVLLVQGTHAAVLQFRALRLEPATK